MSLMTNKAQREEEELLTYFRGMRQASRNTMLATAHTVYAVEESIRRYYGLLPESSPAHGGDVPGLATKRETPGGKPAA